VIGKETSHRRDLCVKGATGKLRTVYVWCVDVLAFDTDVHFVSFKVRTR